MLSEREAWLKISENHPTFSLCSRIAVLRDGGLIDCVTACIMRAKIDSIPTPYTSYGMIGNP